MEAHLRVVSNRGDRLHRLAFRRRPGFYRPWADKSGQGRYLRRLAGRWRVGSRHPSQRQEGVHRLTKPPEAIDCIECGGSAHLLSYLPETDTWTLVRSSPTGVQIVWIVSTWCGTTPETMRSAHPAVHSDCVSIETRLGAKLVELLARHAEPLHVIEGFRDRHIQPEGRQLAI